MDVFCVFFLLSSLSKLSFVSVVFDVNASLNDVAPVSSILLSVDLFFQTRHKTTSRIKNSDRLESLTSEIEFSAGNDVHRKCNTLNRAFFLGTTPYNNNTNVSFSFEFIEKKHYKLHK